MNRIKTIKKIANSLVSKYGCTPPINLEEIYSDLEIEIIKEANQYGIEAYSDLSETVKVYINPELTYYKPRRRFTLAHELGHVCIPWHNGDIKCETDNSYVQINGKRMLDTQELEANIFASEILMPTDWLNEEIKNNLERSFFSLVEDIATIANTSILASLFALEDKLPSGHIYFIRNTAKDYWMTFKSDNTFNVSWNYYEEDNIEFLDCVCERKESKTYANYEVIYYELLACPDSRIVKDTYDSCNQRMDLFLQKVTNNRPLKSLTFIDGVLKHLPERYAVYIICNGKIIKRICDHTKPISTVCYGIGIDNILSTCRYYRFDTIHMDLGESYEIIFVKEKVFEIPSCEKCEPNSLLKEIVRDIWFYEDAHYMLQSINGLISSVNGTHHNGSREELYNWSKYKFYMNSKYEEFCQHPDFEKYIINKIDSMIAKRK